MESGTETIQPTRCFAAAAQVKSVGVKDPNGVSKGTAVQNPPGARNVGRSFSFAFSSARGGNATAGSRKTNRVIREMKDRSAQDR